MSLVPPEISDYVIDFLHDDPKGLRTCNLTCRAFRPAARYHIFQTVNFCSYKAGYTFWQLLQRDPYLGRHARNATLAKITHPTQPGHSSHDGSTAPNAGELWSSIFFALPAVERLELLFLELTDATLRQHIMHHFTAVTRLTLQYCQLPTFGDFVALVRSFPSLADLTVRGVSWQDVETSLPPRRPDAPSPKLTALSLGRDLDLATLADWLVTEDLCANLQSLSVCSPSMRDVVILGDALRAAGPSLHELMLDWYAESNNDVDLPHEFTLAECTSLRSLKICCPIRPYGRVSWVLSALTQLKSAQLEAVSFEIRLLGDIDALDWREVDRILARPDFKDLKSVQIKMKTWHTALQRGLEACDILLKRLSSLNEKGILQLAT